jgi:hypothetical protein
MIKNSTGATVKMLITTKDLNIAVNRLNGWDLISVDVLYADKIL